MRCNDKKVDDDAKDCAALLLDKIFAAEIILP